MKRLGATLIVLGATLFALSPLPVAGADDPPRGSTPPQNPRMSPQDGGSVLLAWEPPTFDGGVPFVDPNGTKYLRYNVYQFASGEWILIAEGIRDTFYLQPESLSQIGDTVMAYSIAGVNQQGEGSRAFVIGVIPTNAPGIPGVGTAPLWPGYEKLCGVVFISFPVSAEGMVNWVCVVQVATTEVPNFSFLAVRDLLRAILLPLGGPLNDVLVFLDDIWRLIEGPGQICTWAAADLRATCAIE